MVKAARFREWEFPVLNERGGYGEEKSQKGRQEKGSQEEGCQEESSEEESSKEKGRQEKGSQEESRQEEEKEIKPARVIRSFVSAFEVAIRNLVCEIECRKTFKNSHPPKVFNLMVNTIETPAKVRGFLLFMPRISSANKLVALISLPEKSILDRLQGQWKPTPDEFYPDKTETTP
ncbi:MAG: hypothetical protein JXA52_06620 [Planctomycetes bacterium]|nr:hypothetical protein [Planctomycetota bacterium]